MLQRGFTLIELMIVVAIVAILAAISIPAYQDFIVRSRLTEVLGNMSACKLLAVDFYQANNGWTSVRTGANVATFDLCSKPTGTRHIQPGGLTIGPAGIITALVRDLGGAVPNGAALTMSPQLNATGEITGWICGGDGDGTTLEPRYRPGSCQG